jgi:alpha-glucosidase (family GH31 glycosyl hydrolase)
LLALATTVLRSPTSHNDSATLLPALSLRYSLLHYLYTTLTLSTTLLTPPDPLSHDSSFFLGPSLLVSPILTPSSKAHIVYLPRNDLLYHLSNGTQVDPADQGRVLSLTPDSHPLIYLIGGTVMLYQNVSEHPVNTTSDLLTKPFSLLVALNSTGQATGRLLLEADPLSGRSRTIPPYN